MIRFSKLPPEWKDKINTSTTNSPKSKRYCQKAGKSMSQVKKNSHIANLMPSKESYECVLEERNGRFRIKEILQL